jgi:hypothetical protein
MAAEATQDRQEHWTANRAVIALVLALSLLPLLGLFVIVPCLWSAALNGTSKRPYAIALVVGVAITVLVYGLAAQIQPT